MTEAVSDPAASDWFRSIAWSLGVPIVVVLVVLGTATIAQRYSRLIAGVSPTLNPFERHWFTRHQRRNVRISLALHFLTVLSPNHIG